MHYRPLAELFKTKVSNLRLITLHLDKMTKPLNHRLSLLYNTVYWEKSTTASVVNTVYENSFFKRFSKVDNKSQQRQRQSFLPENKAKLIFQKFLTNPFIHQKIYKSHVILTAFHCPKISHACWFCTICCEGGKDRKDHKQIILFTNTDPCGKLSVKSSICYIWLKDLSEEPEATDILLKMLGTNLLLCKQIIQPRLSYLLQINPLGKLNQRNSFNVDC